MLIHARHYATEQPVAVAIDSGRIVSIDPSPQTPTQWIAPSFFDPQINGCLGIAFNSPDLLPEQVRTVAEECRKHGIGGFCPTLITGSFESLRHGFATLTQAVAADAELRRWLPCYHLEGPYLSEEDGPRGAHHREHIRNPDWDEFRRWQDAADGKIGMVTIAPERPGAIAFIEKLAAAGVVAAIGHTAASSDQIRAAADAGAKISTHLGNGAHAILPRHPNYIWQQLAEDRLWASIIPDGFHLPPAVVKCIVRAKGIERTLITCDASSLAGAAPGKYREWGTELEVLPSGKVALAGTPYLAGSGHFTDRCVGNLVRDAGISLTDAVEMASLRPRRLLGLHETSLAAVGDLANVVVFDWEPGGEVIVRQVV
ncbi:MAG TPA: N-acetylglucosamine-6-phosphate deacetylase [Urbifossiella sp.]|nr:N-acetylglucosamine-6-phosphate deacetylase [Urbifossiella sp.]